MEKLKLHTPDLTAQKIERVAQLFPNCVAEAQDEQGRLTRAIDFDQLRQELSGSIVDGPRERYHLDWPGKREAILAANAPIAKTLRPSREESVDFDTTKNLFIEGDNLDALKLLQEIYLGKIKLIYIDPPYNTGNDFIYNDKFAADKQQYGLLTDEVDDAGNRMVANTEANGRFHSDWLSMLYPRLKLAQMLLADDGILIVSIDDCESSNLRKACDEIFGAGNFVAQLIWKSRVSEDTRAKTGVSTDHEYLLCFTRSAGGVLRGSEKDLDKFSNPDHDPRGPWRSADLTGLATRDARPNLHYDLIDPATQLNYGCPPKGWRYEPKTMLEKISEKRILFPSNPEGRPRHKLFLNEMKSKFKNMSSVITSVSTSDGTKETNQLLGSGVFSFPKPTGLIKLLLEQSTEPDDIILDFFAGSGTTGHAVMSMNASDGGDRRFILVQLAEPLREKNSEETPSGRMCKDMGKPLNIAEITKERLRRAGAITKAETSLTNPDLDIGFRVLKIDTSNMRDVYYTPDALPQADLLGQVDNIRPDRTPEDLLFQVLVDEGVELALPIAKETIFGKTIFFVDGNALAACFDSGVTDELVKEIAKRKPLRAVFRDASYGSDSVKINVDQIFRLLSPETEVRSI
jgi:adenine-specific DNA-methyltransferase